MNSSSVTVCSGLADSLGVSMERREWRIEACAWPSEGRGSSLLFLPKIFFSSKFGRELSIIASVIDRAGDLGDGTVCRDCLAVDAVDKRNFLD